MSSLNSLEEAAKKYPNLRLFEGFHELENMASISPDEKKSLICQAAREYLDCSQRPAPQKFNKKITYIDLFCGGGGLSLGTEIALNQMGYDARLLLAADTDKAALRLVSQHFKPIIQRDNPINEMIKYSLDLSGKVKDFITCPEINDHQITQFKRKVDLLVGGPPCQGHSNLNNKTRRQDPRNLLYFLMPAFAVALDIPNLVIENVRSIKNAHENVVSITEQILRSNGYHVSEVVINGTDFGVAQTRARHFLIASKTASPNHDLFDENYKMPTLNFDDVNSQLPEIQNYPSALLSQPLLSDENKSRIDYLQKTDSYDLKNELRPVCHQDGHSYPSVYGRLKGDKPAGTITTGFGSPGRGRYIHPYEARMITIREAARLQAFPDWYFAEIDKLGIKKGHLYKIIGDAVPSLLVDPVIKSLFASFEKKFAKRSN